MMRLPQWLTARRQRRSMLAGAALLILALALLGLLAIPAASADASAGLAAAVGPFKPPTRTPRATRTPTPTVTATPSPTPTPTAALAASPTAAPTAIPATPTATETVKPGASSGGQDTIDNAPTADAPSGPLLGWGLAALLVALLGFGGFMVLLTRRPTASSRAAQGQGEPLEQDQGWEPLIPTRELPAATPLKPPRWMIEAGLLKEDSAELPAADRQEPPGKRGVARDGPEAGSPHWSG